MFSTQQYSGFDPRTIPGCALWLDAADSRTLTVSANLVSDWTNKGLAGGSFAIGAGSGAEPTLTTSSNLPSIFFDGVNDRLNGSFTMGNYIDSAGHTAFVVAMPTVVNTDSTTVFSNDTIFGDTTGGYGIYLRSSGLIGTWTFDGATRAITNSYTPSNRVLVSSQHDSTNISLRLNGSNAVSTAAGANTSLGFSRIGISASAVQQFYEGHVFEIITFTRSLAQSERQQVEGYLMWKWNLQSNIPTGHPFRPNPTAMRVFQPIDISACALWYDAADATTITGTTTVTAWNDKSGNARHATATSNHPSFTPGTNYIQFSGSSWMSFPGTFLSNTQYTLFYAVKRDVSQVEMFFMSSGTDTTTNANLHIGYTPNSATLSYRQWANQFSFSVPAFTTQATEPNNVFCFQQNATQRLAFLNGTQVGSNANTSLVLSNNDALLGVYFRSPTTSWNGRFYEVVMYNRALNTSERQQMEGYLATKWGSSSLLPTTQPYYLGRVLPSTPLFTPTSIPGLTLWLDGADSSTFTFSSGTTISQWRDKSSNALTGTAALGPVLSSNAQNGLSAVSLNSTNGSRVDYTNDVLKPGSNQIHMFAVTKINNANAGVMSTEIANFGGYALFRDTNTMNLRVITTSGSRNISSANSTAATQLLTGSWDRSVLRLFVNGTQTASSTVIDSGSLTDVANNLRIGALVGFSGYSLDGQVMEIVLCLATLSESQRQIVEGYLAWKWGLQNSLPTTHPYYKFRP